MALATIPEALQEIRAGKFVIIVDDEDRENEGDLAIAAEKVTPEAINFMAKYGRGLICMPVLGERLDELRIPMMVRDNTAKYETAFTVSIEAKHDTTTGISAHDRPTSSPRGTRFLCGPKRGACWSGRVRPRPSWTWRGSPGSTPRGLSAR
jgi:3,4-dihydroxy-2-butanone 4-phosphate synthase